MPAYRLSSPYERSPLRRRASGFALALAVNLGLLLILLTIDNFVPVAEKAARAVVVSLLPNSEDVAAERARRRVEQSKTQPAVKPPPTVIPSKPTIAKPPPPPPADKPQPFVEVTKDQMAEADLSNLPPGTGSEDRDSQVVGRGPNGETLYAAEWARHPTNTELGAYLPPNAPDGFGLVACKTAEGDRVEDCIELDQGPHGSHLASAVRQAAWQFRVRPPRKNGRPMIGSWVQIRIDYENIGGRSGTP